MRRGWCVLAVSCGMWEPSVHEGATPPTLVERVDGVWSAQVGRARFGLELGDGEQGLTAVLVNGRERIEVADVRRDGETLTLDFAPYPSTLTFTQEQGEGGHRLTGTWAKVRPGRTPPVDKQPFVATLGSALVPSNLGEFAAVDGRWRVNFSSSEDAAVGVFESRDGHLEGTFLTTTGDYRYLFGTQEGDRVTLDCFDGSHAFHFEATLDASGALTGDFWSGKSWHETWTATRDETAALPDAFEMTPVVQPEALATRVFPDEQGTPMSLTDPALAGRLQIITLFGSWCPNCNDEAAVLADLHARYRDRGLSVVGIAFEQRTDPAWIQRVLGAFRRRHGVSYPLLIGGPAKKSVATEAFAVLDAVRSFPTTLFVKDGVIEAVHTGFAGPATGAAHELLVSEWTRRVDEALAD